MARVRPRLSRSKRAREEREEIELVKMAVLAKRSGVPTPTIKHYIREGLLPGPQVRTSKNMAYYDGRIVNRIQTIKALQAEQFLPLRLIGELMEPAPSAALRSPWRFARTTGAACRSFTPSPAVAGLLHSLAGRPCPPTLPPSPTDHEQQPQEPDAPGRG